METLDDVSVGGRVTRSLRKRLTSVDSNDAGSRPSTPQLTKLTSIPESSSPSRTLRASRRNSTTGNGTPLKTLPKAKTSAIAESYDAEKSPAKRTTRRSSISAMQTPNKVNEEADITTKVEKLGEDKSIITKETPVRRVTRLQSKSPPQDDTVKPLAPVSSKKNKPGPKSRRNQLLSDGESDVEVINLEEKHGEETNNITPKMKHKEIKTPTIPSKRTNAVNSSKENIETIDLSDDTLVIADKQKAEDIDIQEENLVSKKAKESPKIISEYEETYVNNLCAGFISNTTNGKDETRIETMDPGSPLEYSITETNNKEVDKIESTLHLELSEDDEVLKCGSMETTHEKNITPSKNQTSPLVESVIMLQKLSPKVIARLCDENNLISPKNSKSVTFDNNCEDDVTKSTYPRTPALVKSKSYIAKDCSKDYKDKSISSNNSSVNSFEDASANIEEFHGHTESEAKANKSKECDVFHDSTYYPEEDNFDDDMEMRQTPLKISTTLQSSTPLCDSLLASKSESQVNAENIEDNSENLVIKPSKNTEDEKAKNLSKSNSNMNNFSEVSKIEQATTIKDYEDTTPKENDTSIRENEDNKSKGNEDTTTPENETTRIKENEDTMTKENEDTTTTKGNDDTITKEIETSTTTENYTTATKENYGTITKEIETSTTKENEDTTTSAASEQQFDVASTNDIIDHKNSKVGDVKNENSGEIFSNSWIHNVSGCATLDNKIDTIASITPANKNVQNINSSEIKSLDKEKTSNVNDKSTNDVESDASEDSFQKLEFVDDEAMEAPDEYQSGDSMDEEVRKEMEDNEILDDGESIGSEDTLSNGSNEGDDEENASFVISDSEESLLEYSDDDEHFEETSKNSNKNKRNSRILITSESEDGERSFDENKAKVTNGITKNGTNKSNRRNCILSSSESESEDETTTKINDENECTVKKSCGSENALNFDVTKMTVTTTDDEINETLPKPLQNLKLKNDINTNKEDGDCNNDTKHKPADCEYGPENKIIALNQSIEKNNNGVSNVKKLNRCNTSALAKITNPSPVVLTSNGVINDNTKNDRRKSFSECMNQTECADCGDQNMGVNEKNTNSKESLDSKEADETIQKALNSSIEPIISADSDAGTIIDANVELSQKEDPYEFHEGKNVVPQSENECSETESDEEEDIEIPETQEVERTDKVFHERSADEEPIEGIDCILNGASDSKNIGLSVSFCQVKGKRNNMKSKEAVHHRSFTIGLSLFKNEADDHIEGFKGSDFSAIESNDSSPTNSANSDKINDADLDIEEVGKIEELKHSNLQLATVKRKHQSMLSYDAQDTEEPICNKKPKRKSMQLLSKDKFNPSKSLIERIETRKRELETLKAKKPSLSKSFCEDMKHESNGLADGSTSCNSNDESDNKDVYRSSTPRNLNTTRNSKRDFGSILERCDKILEAANRAKLESKQNSKKSKVTLPKSKKSSKKSFSSEEESIDHANIDIKEVKYLREKTTVALEQAFRASAKILMDEALKNKKEKLLFQISEEQFDDKRLPMEILDLLSDHDSNIESEERKCNERPHHPIVQRLNSATGEIFEEALTPKKNKRAIFNKIELPTGIVLEEPITPTKTTNPGGFRESPITPRNLGFKVRHILTAGQDKAPELHASHHTEQKRKRKIVDPEHILPKPQWSQSGVFLEEILPNFNDKKRFKLHGANACGSVDSSSALNALKFKNSTIFRKNVPRESSQEVLKRKERQCFSRKYF